MNTDTKRTLALASVGLLAVAVVLVMTLKSNYSDLYGTPSAGAGTDTVAPSTKRHHSGMGGSAGAGGSDMSTTNSVIEELEEERSAAVRPGPQSFLKRTRARSSDLALIQFEEGEEAGRIALRTSREWRIFREWQRRIAANGGGTTLFFDGELGDNHRRYKLAIDGATVDGTIEITFHEGAWQVIAVNSADDEEVDPLKFWRELIDTDESMYNER